MTKPLLSSECDEESASDRMQHINNPTAKKIEEELARVVIQERDSSLPASSGHAGVQNDKLPKEINF